MASARPKEPPYPRQPAPQPVGCSTGNTERRNQLELMGWLSGAMAHEVNNHLAAALIELELALQEELPPVTRELLERLATAVGSAGEVCRSSLSLLRNAQRSAAPEPATVGRAVSRALDCLGRHRNLVRVTLDPQVADSPTPLSVGRLQQVILNGLLNAIQASQADVILRVGTSSIGIGNALGGVMDRSTGKMPKSPHTSIQIEIIDSGPGISEDAAGRLLGLDATLDLSRDGGFGLEIMKQIVVSAGGSVRAQRLGERGTCLEIVLPSMAAGEERKVA